jgi:hypothetical protein
LVNNSFCYTDYYGGGFQYEQSSAKRNRFNCVSNTGNYLLGQYITATGGGTIDEMNAVNNNAGSGYLIHGGNTNYIHKYTNFAFVKNNN